MLQYNRLKFNSKKLRAVPPDFEPLPLKRPRFAPATYGSWVRSQHGPTPGHADGLVPERPGKRVRKPTAAALENLQGRRGEAMRADHDNTGPDALGGGAPAGHAASENEYARNYNNGKGPRTVHGGKGPKGAGAGGKAVPAGAGRKGGRAETEDAAMPGANFPLLARLAMLSGQAQQQLLQRLPGSGDAFNNVARGALRENLPPPPHDPHVEARCRGLRPEHLLPSELPLPLHVAADPLNVSKTLTLGVESRQSLREAEARHERHELRLQPSDASGRHQMSLIIADERFDERPGASNDDAPHAQITFHTHGSDSAHALMRQWQQTHLHEQRAARQRAAAVANPQAHGRGADRYAAHAGALHATGLGAHAPASGANARGVARGQSPTAAGGANRATPPMMQRSGSGGAGNPMQLPRAMQAEVNAVGLGACCFSAEDFAHGLASPMGLGQMPQIPQMSMAPMAQPPMGGLQPPGGMQGGHRRR